MYGRLVILQEIRNKMIPRIIDWRLNSPITAIFFGQSGQGKTFASVQMVEQFCRITNSTDKIKRVRVFYQADDSQYDKLRALNAEVQFYRDIPQEILDSDDEFWSSPDGQPQIVIFDDCTSQINNRKIVNFWIRLITVTSRRQNLSVIFLLHSIFTNLSSIATIRRNVRYLFVFRNSLQNYVSLEKEYGVSHLAEIANKCFNRLQLKYFIIDTRASDFRVYSGIFENEIARAYDV